MRGEGLERIKARGQQLVAVGLELGQWDGKTRERVEIRPQSLGQPHHDVETSIAFEDLTGLFTAHGNPDDRLHVRDVESVARQYCAIEPGVEDRQAGRLLQLYVRRSRNARHDSFNRFSDPDQRLEFIAKDL